MPSRLAIFRSLFLVAVAYVCFKRRYRRAIGAAFLKMLGFGSVKFTSAKDTVPLILSSPEKSDSPSKEHVSLRELVESIVPPVRLNPLIFNGHLQTIWGAVGRGEDTQVHYKRRLWQSNHSTYTGSFSLDFVVPTPANPPTRDKTLPPRTHNFTEEEWSNYIATDDSSPLILVLHGLSGGSHEQYVRHCIKPLAEKGGFAVAVLNARGCCYTKLTSTQLFNARATWDIRQVVAWAREQWPKRRMFAMGFSLGANILGNYLGEEGAGCVLEAAILVGSPWNLDVSNAILNSSWIGLNVYQAALGSGVKKLFERHIDQISQNPDIDIEKVRKSKYLWEWDRHVQCPSWGYPTESAYYRDASSVDAALNIRIPVLALHAKDDPVCADMAVPYQEFTKTPYITMCTTTIGGHLGWYESSGDRWSNRVVYAFLQKFVKETQGMKRQPESTNSSSKSTVSDVNKPIFDPMRRRLYFRE